MDSIIEYLFEEVDELMKRVGVDSDELETYHVEEQLKSYKPHDMH